MADCFYEKVMIDSWNSEVYGLMLVSFNNRGLEDYELGYDMDFTTTRTSHGHTNKLIDYRYSEVFRPTLTFARKDCFQTYGNKFTDHEVRTILRDLSGLNKGYHWMHYLDTRNGEMTFWRVLLKNVTLKKIGDDTVGIVLELEADSPYAYSEEIKHTITVNKNQQAYTLYNKSDLIDEPLYVTCTLKGHTSQDLHYIIVRNVSMLQNYNGNSPSDGMFDIRLRTLYKNETVIIDGPNRTIYSGGGYGTQRKDPKEPFLDTPRDDDPMNRYDFDMPFGLHWLALAPEQNIIAFARSDVEWGHATFYPFTVEITYRERKRVVV